MMKDVKARVAYLKGLIEGSDFIGRDGKGKAVWDNILEIFDDIADSLAEIKSSHDEVVDYMETIDADLSNLEDNFYGTEDEGEYVEMTCPNCHETVYFEEDFMDEDDVEVTCPNCGAVVYSSEDEVEEEESASADNGSLLGGVLTGGSRGERGERAESGGSDEESRRQRRRGRL